MAVIDRAVAGLKESMGLPHQDVNQGGDSSDSASANDNAQDNQRQSPQDQIQQAQAMLAAIGQKRDAQVVEREDILAKKDAALAEKEAQIAALMAGQESLNAKLTDFVEKFAASKQDAPEPPKEPEIANLPENFNELPADQQVSTLMETLKNVRSDVVKVLTDRDNSLKALLPPLIQKVRETDEYKTRNELLNDYPDFDYDRYKPEIDKLQQQYWNMSLKEAAQLVAVRNDPSMLRKREKSAPMVEASRPSMAAASDGDRAAASRPKAPDAGETIRQLQTASLQFRKQGNNIAADRLMDQILKLKVPLPK